MLLAAPLELAIILSFFWILASQPSLPTRPAADFAVTPLVAPPTSQPEPLPKPAHVSLPKTPLPPQPKIELPILAATPKPPPVLPQPKFEMPKTLEARLTSKPPAPPPGLAVAHPAAFSSGSSAAPTVKLPIRKVQTGGFGSPQGLPGQAEGGSKGNVAKLGSFDLPSGPGYGNGTGGAAGARGVVASAGFGNGVAASSEGGSSRAVQSSGFGNAVSGESVREQQNQAGTPDFVPAKIISKPDPVYPQGAKQLHIQGEVLLSVDFEASGHVRVLRVVRGLGHGMDESAKRAAEGILFKPAFRGGRPVDMQAVVHIIFQLAY